MIIDFIEQTRKAFSNLKKTKNALRKLSYMRQKIRSFDEFLSEFDQTLLKAQAHNWDFDQKKNYLHAAISRDLQREMIIVDDMNDYDNYCQQLNRIVNRLNVYNRVIKNKDSKKIDALWRQSSESHVLANSTSTLVEFALKIMNWTSTVSNTQRERAKKMNQLKIDRRMKSDLCLRCEESSHIIRNCSYSSLFDTSSRLESRRSARLINLKMKSLIDLNTEVTEQSKN